MSHRTCLLLLTALRGDVHSIALQRSFTEVTRDVRTILERYDKDRDVSGAPN